MNTNNKRSLLVTMMLVLLIIIIAILAVGNSMRKHRNSALDNTKDNTIENTNQSIAAEKRVPRIPKLETGVNVYELENDIFTIVGSESVRISTDRSSGSGILWSGSKKELVVLTTAHLASDFESGEVELWDAAKVSFDEADVIKHDAYDLAVISISTDKALKNGFEGVHSYINQDEIELGEKVWIIDSVYGAGSGISTAQAATWKVFLEDYGAEMLLLYGNGKEGMSGSPVYDEAGFLVGMISGMSEDKGTLAVVPADVMAKFMESLE